jgi:hypothetical protein
MLSSPRLAVGPVATNSARPRLRFAVVRRRHIGLAQCLAQES